MVKKETLLNQLPPYKDQWVLINPDQNVDDIINEVLEAHEQFAPLYDHIAIYFDGNSTEDIANKLYQFCKRNLKYNEEPETFQSTSVPQGLLFRGECDCKGYANFIGGILDGLNRLGNPITWNYVFASYDLLNKSPHHVFIEARDNDKSYWIDPTPGADKLKPVWKTDKKISATIKNKIGNAAIGLADLTLTPLINVDVLNFDGTHKYDGVFNPMLSLSQYRDFGGERNINEVSMAEQINAILANEGLSHRYDSDFIEWVYNSNIRSWNFFYPWGVKPNFSAANILPASYPKWVITPDGRMDFDKDVLLDDYRNAEIHLMTAWAQALINKYLPNPWPVKPEHIKRFSQGLEGAFGVRNFFGEPRGDSFFTNIANWFKDVINVVGESLLKVFGFIPRNAFLALVGLNVFHMADHLQQSINNGNWEAIKKKWESLGGNPDKLYNTIQKGAGLPAIENTSDTVDANIGEPVTVAAIITAAAPIIAAMLQFLNKDGKLTPVIDAVQNGLEIAFPDIDWTFMDGQLLANGRPVNWQVNDNDNENSPNYQQQNKVVTWVKDNPIAAAGIAAIATAFILKKPNEKYKFTIPAIVGAGIFLFAKSGNNSGNQLPGSGSNNTTTQQTTAQKVTALINWVNSTTDPQTYKNAEITAISQMTVNEVTTLYDVVFNYLLKGLSLTFGSPLYNAMTAIQNKYGLFY